MVKRWSGPLGLCVCVTAFWAAACVPEADPVGHVEVTPAEIPLLYPGFSAYRLAWTQTEAVEGRAGELRASVHLVGPKDEVLRTFDHPLEFEWSPGAAVTTDHMLYQSVLAPPLGAGVYRLEIGLYDGSGNGWPVTSNRATVRVEDRTEGFPAFYFSPEWQPIEGGTDLQILGRRWLRADGVLRLGELTRPGRLWLQIAVPAPIEGEQLLELDPEAAEPEVRVHCSCGDLTEVRRGSGSHRVMMTIVPPDDPEVPPECEISLATNYALIAVEDRVRRTVALESLSWLSD